MTRKCELEFVGKTSYDDRTPGAFYVIATSGAAVMLDVPVFGEGEPVWERVLMYPGMGVKHKWVEREGDDDDPPKRA